MSVIYKHEKRYFKNKNKEVEVEAEVTGDGFIDSIAEIIPKVTNFISQNKDVISSTGKAVSSVAGAASKISDTVKRSNELKDLQLIREQRNKKLEKNLPNTPLKQLPNTPLKTGSGFKIIG